MLRIPMGHTPFGGFLNRMAIGLILLLVVVSLPAIYSLSHSRIKAEQEAQSDSRATVQILGQSLGNTLEKIDYALQVTNEEVQHKHNVQVDRQSLQQFVIRQFSRLPELENFLITDAKGIVLLGSGHIPASPLAIADRAYFAYLKDHPMAKMVVFKPVVSRLSNRWVIPCARRINLPGNRFGGVTVAMLPLQYVTNLFNKASLGQNGSVSLRSSNFDLLVRYTPQKQNAALQHSVSTGISSAWQQKLARGETEKGNYIAESSRDGIKRSYSYRLLQPYQLYLNVGLAVDDYLAAWRKELLLTLLALVFCWVGALLLIRQMYHYKRQTELEKLVQERTKELTDASHELAQNEERLQALLDISEYQATDIQDLLNYALEKVISITHSKIGYIYHYHEATQEFVLNTWSKEVMPACTVANPSTTYKLEKTGIWGEAVRQRRPIMINDFDAPEPLKKGYPEGHIHLSRFLTVPVFDLHQTIVAVVGAANKEQPYTEQDSQQLTLLMAEVWRISQRIELEKKLVHSGHEWQSTFDAISDSVSLINREMRILRCNQACKQLFHREFKDIIGHYCWEVIHNTDGPIEDCPMLRSLQSRKTESQLVFQGNRWLHLTVDPLLDEQHDVSGAVLIIHDDTKRFVADQSQRELLAMLEAVQNELYVFSPDTLLFEYVNQSAQNNLGYNLAQLQKMTPLDIKTMTRQQFMPMIASLVTGDLPLLRFETTHQRADGTSYPVEVNLQMVATHSGRRCLAVIHDITERRQAEQQLTTANEWLANASDAANIALWSWDISSGSLIWSASVDRMLGAAPGDFPRTIEAWEQIIHPGDLERVKQVLTSHLEARTPYEIEYRVCSMAGSYLDWHDSGRAYYDDSGTAIRMSGACIDITDRNRNEQRIRELHAQLLQNEKMASIGQLSAGIAHEINNPMGFINSNLGTLEKYVDKFDRYIASLEPLVQNCCTEQQQQSVQTLRKELKLDYVLRDIRQLLEESSDGAGRVMRIVQDLKTFSRSDTAQIARAELHQCIDSTINIIWNQIKYVAELKKEYGDLPKVPCNVQQVNQVFMNLLVNACHAIQEKQADESGTITVRTWADSNNVYIAIADTGCGISDDVRRRIFEPFYTTKEVGKGTGLGLSISHEIIKKHGGELTVESEVGKGTTFTIRLPLTPPVPDSTLS